MLDSTFQKTRVCTTGGNFSYVPSNSVQRELFNLVRVRFERIGSEVRKNWKNLTFEISKLEKKIKNLFKKRARATKGKFFWVPPEGTRKRLLQVFQSQIWKKNKSMLYERSENLTFEISIWVKQLLAFFQKIRFHTTGS